QPSPVHRAVHAARVRVLARIADIALKVAHILRSVNWLDFHVGHGGETRRTLAGILVSFLEPLFPGFHFRLTFLQLPDRQSPAVASPNSPRNSPKSWRREKSPPL